MFFFSVNNMTLIYVFFSLPLCLSCSQSLCVFWCYFKSKQSNHTHNLRRPNTKIKHHIQTYSKNTKPHTRTHRGSVCYIRKQWRRFQVIQCIQCLCVKYKQSSLTICCCCCCCCCLFFSSFSIWLTPFDFYSHIDHRKSLQKKLNVTLVRAARDSLCQFACVFVRHTHIRMSYLCICMFWFIVQCDQPHQLHRIVRRVCTEASCIHRFAARSRLYST